MQVVEPNGRGELRSRTREPLETADRPTPAPDPEFPLVVVEWHDAWFDLDQVSAEDCRSDYTVRTIGFLLRNGPEFLSLAQEVLPEGEGFRAVTHIPIAIVERVQHLSPDGP